MALLHTLNLIFHISCGFLALTIGLVPMIARKGNPLHIRAGRIFVWAMYGVSLTSLVSFLLHPENTFFLFLLYIGILSFYLTYTGARAVEKQRNQLRHLPDRVANAVILLAGSSMLVLSILQFSKADTTLGVLYLVFGAGCLLLGIPDYLASRRSTPPARMQWFFNHLTRMVGAYIATFTAFCVVNNRYFPALVAWLLPGVLGSMAIVYWRRHYRLKFRTEKG
jgi:uncharacterized membrane protein